VRDVRERLQDILEAIAHIQRHTGSGRETFEKDELIQSVFTPPVGTVSEKKPCSAHLHFCKHRISGCAVQLELDGLRRWRVFVRARFRCGSTEGPHPETDSPAPWRTRKPCRGGPHLSDRKKADAYRTRRKVQVVETRQHAAEFRAWMAWIREKNHQEFGNIEADARAKMLVYLIEQGIMKLEESA
jgi:hypothetical protein